MDQARGWASSPSVDGDVHEEAHLVVLWRAGKHTSAELAEPFSVARSTVYRAVQRVGEPDTAE